MRGRWQIATAPASRGCSVASARRDGRRCRSRRRLSRAGRGRSPNVPAATNTVAVDQVGAHQQKLGFKLQLRRFPPPRKLQGGPRIRRRGNQSGESDGLKRGGTQTCPYRHVCRKTFVRRKTLGKIPRKAAVGRNMPIVAYFCCHQARLAVIGFGNPRHHLFRPL